MYLTGFADEAAGSIDGQIKATKELGWQYIESRAINDVNIHDLPDDEFDKVVEKLAAANIKVNCFGSLIANHGKNINDPFDPSFDEAKRAIPRMQRLGTKLIRIMSYAILDGCEPDKQLEEERFRRLRELQKMFTDAGLTPVHENCMNYGGMGWPFTLKLLENVPGMKLVFDTGNPVFSSDYSKPKPYPKQFAWEFYQHVKEHVIYVHIKDGYYDEKKQKPVFTFPGEGTADVPRIVEDLFKNGYDGGISIEPHIATVFHDDSIKSPEEIKYVSYVEYGKRVIKMIDEIKNRLRNSL